MNSKTKFQIKSQQSDQQKELVHTIFLQREENRYHHSYDEELLQYEYVRDGDMRSIDESKRLFRGGITGKLSDNPLTNKKYLFVASTTLTTRFCIEGGMDAQDAYNNSDIFIQRMDHCTSVREVDELQTEMIIDFTLKMADLHKAARTIETDANNTGYSKPVYECMDYIYLHLHEKITLQQLADGAALSPNYLATLFKKETGFTIQEYIRSRKIEAAKNMLLYSDFSLTEIGSFLAFHSSSHFIRVFREQTGLTPKQYRIKYFRRHVRWMPPNQ